MCSCPENGEDRGSVRRIHVGSAQEKRSITYIESASEPSPEIYRDIIACIIDSSNSRMAYSEGSWTKAPCPR